MKVLLINYGPKPLPATKGGGVETLIEHFYKYYNGKFDLSIASYYEKTAFELSKKYPSVNFIYVRQTIIFKISQVIRYFINKHSNNYYGNAFIVKLRSIINFNDYDIIVSENGIYMGMYLRRFFNGKLVLHLHNDFLNTFTKHASRIKASYDQIWTLSKFVKNRVDTIEGSTESKVLYNGVDLNEFSLANQKCVNNNIRANYGIDAEDIVFAYCGRLVEEKGVSQLIEAFKKVNQQYSNTYLLIIGDDTKRNKYIKGLKSGVLNNIIFTGYIPHSKISEVMRCSDIGVAPTVHLNKYFDEYNNYHGIIEGFNLTVVEFMGLGIPVIVSNSGGMPELVTNDTGIIIDSNEDKLTYELELAMKRFLEGNANFNKERIVKCALRFSVFQYVETFEDYVLLS